MESASSDDFFEDSGSDWTPLNEIEYDSILAFNSDEENVPPTEKNQESDVNIVPDTSSSSDLEEVDTPTRKRKRLTKKWKKNVMRKNKNSGLQYENSKKQVIDAKSMRGPCSTNCRIKCTSKITEEQRKCIFEDFWKLTDLSKQRDFVSIHIDEINPKHRYAIAGSSRSLNYGFFFNINSTRVKVCKTFFLNTLSISDRLIRTVKEKMKNGFLEEDIRGKHKKQKSLDSNIKESIKKHIELFPTIESHYLRKQTTRTYISGNLNVAKMYRMYVEYCKEQGMQKWSNLAMYQHIFNFNYNIGFFIPKKDLCNTCESYKNTENKTNEIELLQNLHLSEKNAVRLEKENDKQKAIDGFQSTACFDLQAILIAPDGEVSSFYYKRRLATYNFTIYNMKNGEGTCYVWNETIAKRGANEIGKCLLDFMRNELNGTENNLTDIIFYSDNCSGQNKNKFIACLYLYASLVLNINTIRHKFLIVGHTQNEGDYAFSNRTSKKIGTPKWPDLCTVSMGISY